MRLSFKPILSKLINSRCQLDLIDTQIEPGRKIKTTVETAIRDDLTDGIDAGDSSG